jgi:hypothetical protein
VLLGIAIDNLVFWSSNIKNKIKIKNKIERKKERKKSKLIVNMSIP